ncbi:MAG: type II toxin-antitoxin system RelE/ParE family toxin [Proteobacteria bacterium]|nr:type II toxin-antitoxin system RelE/ParE family toxin [Pseudomonadota bacterium]
MIQRCSGMAAGTAPSQGCRPLIDPELPENLCFSRSGQHFIGFVEEDDRVVIVDFLHARSDLPRKLAALADTRTRRGS